MIPKLLAGKLSVMPNAAMTEVVIDGVDAVETTGAVVMTPAEPSGID